MMAFNGARLVDIDEDCEDLEEYFYLETGSTNYSDTSSEDDDDDVTLDENEVALDNDSTETVPHINVLRRFVANEQRKYPGDESEQQESGAEGEQSQRGVAAPGRDHCPTADIALTEEVNYKLVSKCTCRIFCLDPWIHKLDDIRAQAQSLDRTNLDLLILGKLSVIIDCSRSVDTKSHTAKERVKSRSSYLHESEYA